MVAGATVSMHACMHSRMQLAWTGAGANFPKLGGKARCVTMATRYFVTAVML